MDVNKAVELFWAEVAKSSLRRVAKSVPVGHTTAAGWRDGVVPEGKNRELLIEWAEKLPGGADSAVLASATAAARATASNVRKLAEIRGQARAVLSMLNAVAAEQQKVVDSLEPYADAEAMLDHGAYSAEDRAVIAAAFAKDPTPSPPEDAQPVPRKPRRAAG